MAVVDAGHLQSVGVPLADGQRPHVTLCSLPPWQPRHSNDLLEAHLTEFEASRHGRRWNPG